ncbi:putative Nucleoside transporter [Trypanosoma vivax]|uniref:Putative adenosine transporter 2 n=1 Tax=Trypanosoma vivax (strain Y486) TaxID=1055687 RepID=G0TS74_TRYVY|nr:putative Nucleoside transporter [Trypanosoma vivax]CCC46800.1 putative adenosine transporter 2 [Trypanosoma vivax Y486]
MAVLGFESTSALLVYVSFLFFGMSLMLTANSIYSLYGYSTEFYRLAQGDPNATTSDPDFWKNIYTYYNVVLFSLQLSTELFMLTPLGRRIPLRLRLALGFSLSFVQLLSYMMVTTFHTSESGAKCVFLFSAFVNGIEKSLCGSSTVALAGPFPTKFFAAVILGIPFSGVITGILSVTVKASMDGDFHSLLHQSYIYFSIAMVFQSVTCVLLYLLPRNPYALRYAAEFRYAARGNPVECEEQTEKKEANGAPDSRPAKGPADDYCDDAQPYNTAKNVLDTSIDPDTMKDTDQVENTTSAEQMLKAEVWVVIKRIYPVLSTCFFVYFTTVLFFPGVFISVDYKGWNHWYGTAVMVVFNLGDFVSCMFLQFKRNHPSPKAVIIGSFARLLIAVPLFLCQRRIIEGHAAKALSCVLSLLWGMTNGFCGGMMLIYGPRTASLTTAGQRSLAGICNNVSLLVGLFAGSAAAIGLSKTL